MRKRILWVAAAALLCWVPAARAAEGLTKIAATALKNATAGQVKALGIIAALDVTAISQGEGMIGANVSGRYLGK